MTAFPTLLSPLEVRGGTLRNRVVMGSMHTGLEDRPWHVPQLAAYFAERARGGVGLIVTGGYSPNVRGWLLPFGSQMTIAPAGACGTGRSPTRCTRRAARSRCSSCTPAATATRRSRCRRRASKSPITPFKASGMSAETVEQTITRLRARRRGWRRRPGTTASRSWAPRAT